MRRIALIAAIGVTSVFAAATFPDLGRIRKVYVLSMGSGLDQYLANRIVETGQFEITTDPQSADAILTDRVGEPFERRLKDLYPELDPKTAKDNAKSTSSAKTTDTKTGDSKATDSKTSSNEPDSVSPAATKDDRPISSFSRGRGNIFLVERATRKVVWSTYERPKNRSSDELNHVAGRIAKELQKAAAPPAAKQ